MQDSENSAAHHLEASSSEEQVPSELWAKILMHVCSDQDAWALTSVNRLTHELLADVVLKACWLMAHKPPEALVGMLRGMDPDRRQALARQLIKRKDIVGQVRPHLQGWLGRQLSTMPPSLPSTQSTPAGQSALEQKLALHWACDCGAHDLVQLFLDLGADVHEANASGWTPLHIAYQRTDLQLVTLLQQAGGDVHAVNTRTGDTTLHEACAHAEKWDVGPAVGTLLAAGLRVDARNKAGQTPLLAACRWGVEPTVRALIMAGADVNAAADNGDTALHMAAASRGSTYAIVRLLLDSGTQAAVVNAKGYTPLHLACGAGKSPAVLRKLIEAGVDADAAGVEDNVTALHLAEQSYGQQGSPFELEEVRCLLREAGASRSLISGTQLSKRIAGMLLAATARVAQAQESATSLHDLARTHAPQLLAAKLAAGADPNEVDERGRTALMIASKHGWVSNVGALLASGADPCVADVEGNTALHVATYGQMVPLLAAAGVGVDAANLRGETPLIAAVKNQQNGVMLVVLEAGADVRARDSEGNTALHHASWDGAVTALLAAGVELDAANAYGETALDVARRAGWEKAARALMAADKALSANS